MKYPLMRNNILREDLDKVIIYLKKDDPKLTNGANVKAFEEEWSKWLGVKYSVFVNSGSSANLMSLSILKTLFPEGGEVIVPPLTWISDIASVLQTGFEPKFVDINPYTLAMDENLVLSEITSKTRAVFLTHVQGFNGLSDKLIKDLTTKGILLIEDVCESHGATHNGKKLGSFGWISNFSFYYAHHMSTIEGGMLCTNDFEVYQKARMFRSHGMTRECDSSDLKNDYKEKHKDLNSDFIFAYAAYNFRNNEIGGILGRSQLKRLNQIVKKRTENFKRFLNKIDDSKYRTDFKVEGSSNYAFNLIMKKSDPDFVIKLMRAMKNGGIEFRRGSAGGGNQLRQPYLKNSFEKNFFLKFPQVEHIHFYGFYIGNFPDLDFYEVDEICHVLNSVK